MEKIFLEPEEVAQLVGMSESWLEKHRQVIPCVKIGAKVKYRPKDLQDFADRLPLYTKDDAAAAEVAA